MIICTYWDIDGTLLLAPPGRADLFREALAAMGADRIQPNESRSGHTDLQLARMYLAAAGLDPAREDEFLASLDAISVPFYTDKPRALMPGVLQALTLATELGWRNALLTGNTPLRARTKLATAGIDPDIFDWSNSTFGGFEADRNRLGTRAREISGDNPVLVIGDTWRDYQAAIAAAAHFVGVTDEAELATRLEQERVDLVIPDLADARFANFAIDFTASLR